MSDRPLPRPVTATDFYLSAILDELKGLRADGKTAVASPVYMTVDHTPDLIDIREPAPLVMGTPFPDDFPGRDALEAAGIVTLETVPRDGDALTAIKGIGKATAGRILTELANT